MYSVEEVLTESRTDVVFLIVACGGSPFCALNVGSRERKERGGSVISVAESMSMKRRRNSIRSHSLQTHRKSFLLNEISEKTWNEELNKLFLVKIQLREN